MEGAGWIERSGRPGPREDERRRSYRLTPLGLAVARAETARLAELVREAATTPLIEPSAVSK